MSAFSRQANHLLANPNSFMLWHPNEAYCIDAGQDGKDISAMQNFLGVDDGAV